MLVSDLIAAMQAIAPLHLAEEWDNVGLLVGDASRPLNGPTLLTIDLTTPVLDEAIAAKAAAIIAYHPPLFQAIKRLVMLGGRTNVLLRAINAGMAIYSPHTALDAAPGGVTDWLIEQACGVSPSRSEPLSRISDDDQQRMIVTFVPRDSVERVRTALAGAGAGVIGDYECCSFVLEGRGTFKGTASTNPAVGQRGVLEQADEARLEMVCRSSALAASLEALRAVHPYEAPAINVYALVPGPAPGGAGRVATLDKPEAAEAIAKRLKSRLGAGAVYVAETRNGRPASRIAVVPGSGGSLLDAAIQSGADCFVTGEMKHHEVLGAVDRGCAVILAGHTETERGYLPVLAQRLNETSSAFRATVSQADAPPLRAI